VRRQEDRKAQCCLITGTLICVGISVVYLTIIKNDTSSITWHRERRKIFALTLFVAIIPANVVVLRTNYLGLLSWLFAPWT